jgi:hypothetical protein
MHASRQQRESPIDKRSRHKTCKISSSDYALSGSPAPRRVCFCYHTVEQVFLIQLCDSLQHYGSFRCKYSGVRKDRGAQFIILADGRDSAALAWHKIDSFR